MTAFIEVDNVTRWFAGLLAVDHVSLRVEQNEIVSIIGPNGAGKTTLFNMMTGQLDVSSGNVALQGRSLNGLPPHARARLGMGRTFQVARPLVALTALDNVMVGSFLRHPRARVACDRAWEVLAEVGLAERAGVPAADLTLGERRRLEVARALATDPTIVFLDEVMAGLNATEIAEALELFRTLNRRGITFLVIEHNLKAVREFSDRVIVLDRGAKIAEGSAEDVLRDPGVVRAYLGRRAS